MPHPWAHLQVVSVYRSADLGCPPQLDSRLKKDIAKNENDRDRVRREEGLESNSIQEGRRKMEVKRES